MLVLTICVVAEAFQQSFGRAKIVRVSMASEPVMYTPVVLKAPKAAR